ncbi:ABC transporter permease, partial [Rhizobium johnstonii]
WPLIASDNGVLDKIAAGQGALINEHMWRRGEAKIGQPLFMPGGWSATVVGVYSDYGNPNGQAIIGNKADTVAKFRDIGVMIDQR